MKTPTIILIIVSCVSVDALACKSDVECGFTKQDNAPILT